MKLCNLLKNARESLGYTLNVASDRAGISSSYLWELETGKATRPKIDVLQRLSEVYCISPDRLIIAAGKVPPDVYRKIVSYPALVNVIRNMEV